MACGRQYIGLPENCRLRIPGSTADGNQAITNANATRARQIYADFAQYLIGLALPL